MIKNKDEITIRAEKNSDGSDRLFLHDLTEFEGKNPKVRMFSRAVLLPGQEVKFHVHTGEAESYYILSGKGLYDDNGSILEVEQGTITFTPSGSGHGIKNIGTENLEFIALIVLD